MKRLLAIVMTLCMVLGVSGIGVYAAEGDNYLPYEQKSSPVANGLAPNYGGIINGQFYVIAAYGSFSYDPIEDNWASIGVGYTSAVIIEDKIYAIRAFTSDLDMYDPQTGKWINITKTPNNHNQSGVTAIGNKIYYVGQANSGVSNIVEVYDIELNEWKRLADYPISAGVTTCTDIDGKLYSFAVHNPSYITKVYRYDPDLNKWEQLNAMPFGGYQSSKMVIKNQKGYLVVGNKLLMYDILTDSWATVGTLQVSHFTPVIGFVGDELYVLEGYTTAKNYAYTIEGIEPTPKPTTYLLSVLLNVSEQVQLSITHNLADNTTLTWTSSNEKVATVDSNGRVTAVGAGTALIYAENEDGTFKESIPVKVLPGGADFFRLAVHLNAGQQAKLYLSDDTENIVWSSMDESIATVSADGVVTGVSKGLVIVQGEIDGESYQIYVRVND